MRKASTRTFILASVATSLASVAAHAEQVPAHKGRDLLTKWGMSMSIGGGIVNFTNDDAADFTDVGGLWEARFAFGTRRHIAIEAAYTGAAQGIDALGLDNDAVLVATGLDAAVRVNVLPGDLQPYFTVGMGWKRYDLAYVEDENTSSVNNRDHVFEMPVGVGLGYRIAPVLLDLRASLRPAFGANLIDTGSQNTEVGLHTWTASLRAGWEF